MSFVKRTLALAGVVLSASLLVPDSSAYAYGQQWRPTANFAAADPRHYRRTANIPSFRPHARAPRQAYRPPLPHYPSYRSARAYVPSHAPVRPAQAMYGYPAYAYMPPPQFMPAYAPMPPWVQPFGEMARAWQTQVPLFSRQFAWRPAEQPWIARDDRQARRSTVQPAHRAAYSQPRTAAYQPASHQVPRWAGWRPQSTYPTYPGAGYVQPPRFASSPFVAGVVPQPRPAWISPAGRTGAGAWQWRPQPGAQAGAWQTADSAFRPAGYGRSVASIEARPPRDGGAGFGFTRDELPGWVTTHQRGDLGGFSCSWCSGS